ncbi:MAG: energy-coupling factor ABC transporter ATP-binding protein, partial [Coriobacteriales bacterium]|nr:energy-coupling factor ABC transporter ATP-binding protein [Coriobacteriales bacterium]
MGSAPVINFRDVSFNYRLQDDDTAPSGGSTPEAATSGIRATNFSVYPGECVVLCGRSGCGKTTVTRLINGLAPQFYAGDLSGTIEIDGTDVTSMGLAQRARLVGSVFQNPRSQFFNVDTTSELAFGCENLALKREEIVARTQAAAEVFSLEDLLGRSIFELSGGEKQRIACGSVYAMHPQIYLLDEPSSNLDLSSIAQMRKAFLRLKQQGKTIVIAEHRLHYLKGLANRYLYFEDGHLKDELSAEAFDKLSADERSRRGLRESSLHTLFSQPVSSAQQEPSQQAASPAQRERSSQTKQAGQRTPAVVRAEG